MKIPDPLDHPDIAPARDRVVGDLLRAARADQALEPSPERATRVRDHVRAAWSENVGRGPSFSTGRPSKTPWSKAPWLLAAALAMAVLGAAWFLRSHRDRPTATPTVVATVRSVTGTVLRAESRGAIGTALKVGDPLYEGDVLRTGIDRLAFSLVTPSGTAGTADVRIDRGAEVRLGTGGTIELDRGALYAQTGDAGGNRLLTIVTPFGTARDIGTRFAVRVSDQDFEVAVRDGAVEIATDTERHRADAGMAITLSTTGEAASRVIESFDPLWSWTAMLAPTFELDGASFDSFLTWLRRESGWSIRFRDPDLERAARGWQMHGPVIENMRLEEALALALGPNELEFEIDDGVVTIGETNRTNGR